MTEHLLDTEYLKRLEEEIRYLRSLLDERGIAYNFEGHLNHRDEDAGTEILPIEASLDTARLVYSMFQGRKDVYARRSKNKIYYPQCQNRWKPCCHKNQNPKSKCSECGFKEYEPLRYSLIIRHIQGQREDCSDVLGIYPLWQDDSCRFIVFDFDNHSEEDNPSREWQEEVDALRRICSLSGIDALVERSRSGNGAHVWIFFSEPVSARKARRFGNALVTKGSESVSLKSFRYYDRLMPMQDSLPDGGLGNLIALPLQGQAVKNGNSVFVDEDWKPYHDQLKKLSTVRKLSESDIDGFLKAWRVDDEVFPQEDTPQLERNLFSSSSKSSVGGDDATGLVEVILKDGIYVSKDGLSPRLQNAIRRIAAYKNPEFYKQLRLGFPTLDIPRIVYCGYDTDRHIVLPRGCDTGLKELLFNAGIDSRVVSERQSGRSLNITFNGALYPEQSKAAKALLEYDNGILNAATSFGKTVVGAYLVAQRKVNTLILVHNVEIMNRWVEDLTRFLSIDEPYPSYTTPTGRIKFRTSLIGTFSSQKNNRTGIVDVAMVTSLGKANEINPVVNEYGMVIMDECHHAAAFSSESVLRSVRARYVYGMTATLKRDDGQDRRILMHIGPVRYTYSAKERAAKQGIGHYVYPRFTRLIDVSAEKLTITKAFGLVVSNSLRNSQIVADAVDCINKGRTPIVMTKRKDHASELYGALKDAARHVFLLQGGGSVKEREAIRCRMESVPKDESMALVAIGQYVGEGFNYPRLDTLLLAMPISFENNVEQYAGRLNRDYEGKKDVIIFDYIDQHIPILERMYHKRMRTYRRIGFEICSEVTDTQDVHNSIFDSATYYGTYRKDLESAKSSVIISSPGLGSSKVQDFIKLSAGLQERGVAITVLTLPPTSYPADAVPLQTRLSASLSEAGITVRSSERCREHFAVIDRSLVWYGSMNLLSREREDDNLMRLQSEEIAQELLERLLVK